MDESEKFEEDEWKAAPPDGEFVVDLNGYEGPIDVLLALARNQKVDLAKISILQLAEQYLAFIKIKVITPAIPAPFFGFHLQGTGARQPAVRQGCASPS